MRGMEYWRYGAERSAAERLVCCKQYEDLYEIVGDGACAEWLNYGGLLGA